MKFPLIIAHRGDSANAPENTLAAFRQAVEIGADGLEFDVRLSKNGVPVVFHDPTLRRIAGKSFKVINIKSDELAEIDAGTWFNQKFPRKLNDSFSKERISTLENTLEYLEHYRGLLYIELKCTKPEIAPLVEAVAKVIKKSKLFPNIIVKSFKLPAIFQIKKLLPEICTAALFAPKILTVLRKQTNLIEKAEIFNADELSLHFSLATQKLVERAQSRNLKTIIWTADHPVWIKRAYEIGIKAIITNNPARLLETRRNFSENISGS